MIEALEGKGYDVGFVGELNEAGVYVDDADEALLRAEGYTIGETVEDDDDVAGASRLRSRRRPRARRSPPRSPAERPHEGGQGQGRGEPPGEVVIMRAYTFTNYAGRFLYVEAHNSHTRDLTTGPAMSFVLRGPRRRVRPSVNLGGPITPDGGDAQSAATRSDGDARPSYMYHRGLVALRGADANLQAGEVTVRVARRHRRFDTSRRDRVDGQGAPPRVATFQKDFITKYMDPTEIYNRMDQLVDETTGPSSRRSTLPNKTDGYQRPAWR